MINRIFKRLYNETRLEQKSPLAILSRLRDPYINLAIENHIFNKMPIKDSSPKRAKERSDRKINSNRLFIYENSKCIVFGKNQNPWKEVNLQFLRQHSEKYELLRRYSGGGTVVHDKGNVNYSFMTTKSNFNRTSFLEIIKDELNASVDGLCPVQVNERGDLGILVNDSFKKISGSAYKISRGKSYHHGTMLLNCDLSKFKGLLNKSSEAEAQNQIIDRSVDSKKVPIGNLNIPQSVFEKCLINGFSKKYGPLADVCEISSIAQMPQEVFDTAAELRSWDFKFGKTPAFRSLFELDEKFGIQLEFKVEKGMITDLDITVTSDDKVNLSLIEQLVRLKRILKSSAVRYTSEDIVSRVNNEAFKSYIKDKI